MSEFDDNFFLDDPWVNIDEPNYPRGRYLYQRDRRFFVSINESMQINFFVEEKGEISLDTLPNLSGIELSVDNSQESKTRLVCTLIDDALKDKFATIAKDVAFTCSEFGPKEILFMCKDRIESWANFLKPSRKGLRYSEWIGFWGEMYTLTNLIYPEFEIEQAINFWIGPTGGKQDFTFNNTGLELKTTEAGDANEIKISSLDQLHKVTDNLFLMHLHINKSNDEIALSLQGMYENVLNLIQQDTGLINKFENKISNLYGKASQEQLEGKFNFLGHEIYEINEKFPCLTKSNAPSSVLKAKYSLDPVQLKSFEISTPIPELIQNG
tara:strand:+ start:5335 stop:6309 length:975 start_codon:yes stop_codon:yes gene_type:complete